LRKPFALTVTDAKAAITACRKAGVALGVGHNRRLWPSIVKLKEVVSSNELGTVMFAEGNYSHDILANTPLDNWRSGAAGDQGRRHDRHGHPSARCVQLPDRPDDARERALHQSASCRSSRVTPRRR
jgi:predicted dehydrogenase